MASVLRRTISAGAKWARYSSMIETFGKTHARALVEEHQKAVEEAQTKQVRDAMSRHTHRPPERNVGVKREHLHPESIRFIENFERVVGVGVQDGTLHTSPLNMVGSPQHCPRRIARFMLTSFLDF